jgi:hypothetical protein
MVSGHKYYQVMYDYNKNLIVIVYLYCIIGGKIVHQ